MGKRELLIALAFLVVGAVAFQLSAPPAKTTSTGFSFSKLIDSARREMRGNATFVAPAQALRYAVASDSTELRILGSAGPVKILGEDRPDVLLELTVTSTGTDEATALEIARRTVVKEDRVGSVLTLQFEFPKEETQTSTAVLKVPTRLGVRLDGTRETTISHVHAVELTSAARGTTDISHIAGRVSGEQSGGTITLASIGVLKMTLTRTRGRISDIIGEANLDVRDGDTEIITSRGPLTIEERRGNITIRAHKGIVKVSGSEGRLRLEGTTDEVRLDLRRTEVEAELAHAVASSVVTSDEELRVSWTESPDVRIDAIARKGSIDATDWALTPTKSSDDVRLDAAIGASNASTPRVSLRNQGANIVIKKSRKK